MPYDSHSSTICWAQGKRSSVSKNGGKQGRIGITVMTYGATDESLVKTCKDCKVILRRGNSMYRKSLPICILVDAPKPQTPEAPTR
jgi:hypothetical protein